jgi:hypothetical protein
MIPIYLIIKAFLKERIRYNKTNIANANSALVVLILMEILISIFFIIMGTVMLSIIKHTTISHIIGREIIGKGFGSINKSRKIRILAI